MRKLMPLVLITALAACETESYDSGQGGLSLTTADFAEAHSDASRAVDYAVTDNGDSLALSPEISARWITTPDTTYRVVLYYDRTGKNTARPVSISQIPTLAVVPADRFDRILTDPVTFESIWLSKTGKYLNIGMYLKNGETGSDGTRHTVGMAHDSTATGADGSRTAYLRLYHDQGGVPEYYSSKYYVSLPCAALPYDSVCVSIVTYGGTVTHRLSLPEK